MLPETGKSTAPLQAPMSRGAKECALYVKLRDSKSKNQFAPVVLDVCSNRIKLFELVSPAKIL